MTGVLLRADQTQDLVRDLLWAETLGVDVGSELWLSKGLQAAFNLEPLPTQLAPSIGPFAAPTEPRTDRRR